MKPTSWQIREYLERGQRCDRCAQRFDIYELIFSESREEGLSILCDTCLCEQAKEEGDA